METVSEAIIQRYNGHHSKRTALLALYTVSLFPMVLYHTRYSSFEGPIERRAAGIESIFTGFVTPLFHGDPGT